MGPTDTPLPVSICGAPALGPPPPHPRDPGLAMGAHPHTSSQNKLRPPQGLQDPPALLGVCYSLNSGSPHCHGRGGRKSHWELVQGLQCAARLQKSQGHSRQSHLGPSHLHSGSQCPASSTSCSSPEQPAPAATPHMHHMHYPAGRASRADVPLHLRPCSSHSHQACSVPVL